MPAEAQQPGTKKWETKVGIDPSFSVAIAPDDTIYVCGGGKTYALNGRDGSKVWESNTGGNKPSPALGSDGTLFVASKGKVVALDGRTGVEKWANTPGSVFGSPAIGGDGTVYLKTENGTVVALDALTGEKRWEQPFSFGTSSVAVGADDSLYFGGITDRFLALDGKTGAKKWDFKAGSIFFGSPAIGADGTVFVGNWDGRLYALNGQTGVPTWVFRASEIYATPAIAEDGTVYIGDSGGRVFALDGKAGIKKWEFSAVGSISSALCVGGDGTVYATSFSGGLYALDGQSGTKKWSYQTGFAIESCPVIATDGTLYLVFNQQVLALATESRGLAASAWPSFRQNPRNTASHAAKTRPTIVGQPKDQTIPVGQTLGLEASAYGPPPLAYQWIKDGVRLPGRTNAILSLPGARIEESGRYQVAVSGPYGVSLGREILVTVEVPELPRITLQPESSTNLTASRFTLQTEAYSVLPLTFQWSKDGIELAGATNRTLTIGSALPKHSGRYSVVVMNRLGSRVSTEVNVSVPPPAVGEKWWVNRVNGCDGEGVALGDDGTVYCTFLSRISALDGLTGEQRWVGHVPSGYGSPRILVSPDNEVWVGRGDETIVYDGRTGKRIRWFGGEFAGMAVLAFGKDGTAYLGSSGHRLRAVDAKTLDAKWERFASFVEYYRPSIGSDGTLYFPGGSDGILHAVDGQTGATKWEFVASKGVFSGDRALVFAPAMGLDDAIYIGLLGGDLFCLDGRSGKLRWRRAARCFSAPVVGSDGVVYFSTGKFIAVNGESGAPRWSVETSASFYTAAIGADGIVYAGCADGRLFAFNGQTGAKEWEFSAGHQIGPQLTIGSNGMVYVPTYYGWLYALESTSKGLAESPWPKPFGDAGNSGRIQPDLIQLRWHTPDGMELEVPAPRGKTLMLESTTDFDRWEKVMPVTGSASGGPVIIPLSGDRPLKARFWRVRGP